MKLIAFLRKLLPAKEIIKPITLNNQNSKEWNREVIEAPLFTRGSISQYQGSVLRSAKNSHHHVEFTIESNGLRRVKLDVPVFFVSTPACPLSILVLLNVEDQEIAQYDFVQDERNNNHLFRIRKDITKITEATEASRVSLDFFYGDRNASINILASTKRPRFQFRSLEKCKLSYGLTSVLFFATAWLSILLATFLILIHVRTFGDSFRFYASLTAAVAWVIQITGIADLKKLSLKPILRKLYAKTAGHRKGWVFGGAALLLLLASFSSIILYALTIRYQYSRLINKAIDGIDAEQSIQRAFVLVPWRKEAQILLEEELYSLRNYNDRDPQDELIRAFSKYVDATIPNWHGKNLPFYLNRQEGTISDPRVWYSSILSQVVEPSEQGYRPIFELLEQDQSKLAELQKQVFRFHLSGQLSKNDPSLQRTRDDEAVKLRKLLVSLEGDLQVTASFEYQQAYDGLGAYDLQMCYETDQPTSYDQQSYADFKQVLLVRRNLRRREVNWHEAPDKLDIFRLLCVGCSISKPGEDRRNLLLLNFGECYCRHDNRADTIEQQLKSEANTEGSDISTRLYKRCGEIGLIQPLLTTYPEFKEHSTWMDGTVRQKDYITTYVRTKLLNEGWWY